MIELWCSICNHFSCFYNQKQSWYPVCQEHTTSSINRTKIITLAVLYFIIFKTAIGYVSNEQWIWKQWFERMCSSFRNKNLDNRYFVSYLSVLSQFISASPLHSTIFSSITSYILARGYYAQFCVSSSLNSKNGPKKMLCLWPFWKFSCKYEQPVTFDTSNWCLKWLFFFM